MAVTVLDSKRIQISDWRPDADTTYTHSGTYTVDGENLEITGFELGDREILKLDGRVYKAIHHPTVLASTGPVTLYPLTSIGKYFTIAHNTALWCPREMTIVLRFKYVSRHGTNTVLIAKGDGTAPGVEWEIGIDASGNPWFYDGANGYLNFTTLAVPTSGWTTLGLKVSDDAPSGTTSTVKMVINGVSEALTVNPVSARPMGTGLVYVSSDSINPASDGISAYWDHVALWDEPLEDSALINAMDYLKMQQRGLVVNAPFPYVTTPTVSDLATAYEVEM
jgi:hypothetical protein